MTFLRPYPSLFWISLGASLIFHLSIFFFFTQIAQLFGRTPRWVPVTIQMVSLPSSPTSAPPGESSSPSVKDQEKTPPPAPPKQPQPTPPKRTVLHRGKIPAKPKPSKTPLQKDPPPEATLKEIRDLLKSYPVQTGGGGAGASTTGYELPAGIEGRLYFREVISAIQSAWRVPPGSHKKIVEMEILLDSQGKLLSYKLTRGSGDPLLDRSAESAILSTSFPPPPPGWRTPLHLKLILIPPEVP